MAGARERLGRTGRLSRQPPRDAGLAGLMEARSASVALAASGDSSRLHDFVEHLNERGKTANLNYWAHSIVGRAEYQVDPRSGPSWRWQPAYAGRPEGRADTDNRLGRGP